MQIKRFGRPGEVADIVSFLVSENASYITGKCPSKTAENDLVCITFTNVGQTINVDGGSCFD